MHDTRTRWTQRKGPAVSDVTEPTIVDDPDTVHVADVIDVEIVDSDTAAGTSAS